MTPSEHREQLQLHRMQHHLIGRQMLCTSNGRVLYNNLHCIDSLSVKNMVVHAIATEKHLKVDVLCK